MQFNALCPIHADSQRPAKAWLTKTFLVMQLTGIILLAGVLHVSASGVSQTITYTGKSVSLTKVFSVIEKQTGFVFFYDKKELQTSEPVTVKFQKVPLNEALQQLFAGHPLEYEIQGNTIFITKKPLTADLSPRPSSSREQQDSGPVKGRVVNEKGEPVEGVSVTVKGSNVGTSTNANGEFFLDDIDDNATLVFTHTSIEKIEKKRSGRNELTIGVKVRSSILDEVQVIPYGTQTRRFAVGNVTTVKGEDIAKQPVNNPLLALSGKVPGLFISQSTGFAGSGVRVRIQGENSLSSGNDPLYVVDGVPYTSQLLPSITDVLGYSTERPGFGQGNPLSFINPADIESINVLKDADATSIYGSRAANGAILITTRKGRIGATRVTVNAQQGWGQVTRKMDLLNTKQYLEMRHEAKLNDGQSVELEDYDINGFWDTTRYTDWQKELIGGTAKYTDVQSTITGGNASAQYLIGAGFHRESTVLPLDFSDRKGSLHFNINNNSSTQKFKFLLSGNYLIDNNHLPVGDFTTVAMQLAPNAPTLYNSDGTLNWAPRADGVSTWDNPLIPLYIPYKNKTSNLIANSTVSYQVFPGLELKTSFGFTSLQNNEHYSYRLSVIKPEEQPFASRGFTFGNNDISSWLVEPQAVYKKVLRTGNIELLAGATTQQENRKGMIIRATGQNSDLVLEDLHAAPFVEIQSTNASIYKYNAVYGRISYNLQDKYLAHATVRRDGSSRFGPENQFHNFSSLGLGWIFTGERFLQNSLAVLSFGKLRASYGTTGNDQIGDYRYLNLYDPVAPEVPYQEASGLQPKELPNPYLEWEETKKLQLGLEVGLLRDRIFINVNYFSNRTSNQLLPYALPITTGFLGITKNFPALVRNSGWEMSLSTTNIKNRNFTWTTDFNLTSNRNKLVSYPDFESSPYSIDYIVGEPITISKQFHYVGIDPATGIYQFEDKDKNLTSRPGEADRTAFGNNMPKYYGGLQNNFRLKGFELSFLFQFVNQRANDYSYGNLPGVAFVNQPITVLDRWQTAGDKKSVQKFSSSISSVFRAMRAIRGSDVAFVDASYIRLRNLAISWSLPDEWRKKAHMQNCKLFVHGQNLLTITNYMGLDPENRGGGPNFQLPPLRVLTMGIQVEL